MTTKKKKTCLHCQNDYVMTGFYMSNSKMHSDGRIPICKKCLRDMTDFTDADSLQNTLRQIDKPFVADIWENMIQSGKENFGLYMKNIGLQQYRYWTWDDSDFGHLNERVRTNSGETLTSEEIEKLEDDWGYGFKPQELIYFERKYESLINNYPAKTSLHEEALRAYCVYKVRAEIETANGNVKDAKEWATLAQKQGEIAKINLNKLTKSDLSQGLDGFSQLARMVEQAVDIIPILPEFIEKPKDKIDFAIWCYINYERRLHGLPEVEYSDIYEFYQDRLKEHMKANPELEDIVKEVEIDYDGKGTKKKLLTIKYKSIARKKMREDPDDPFVKNLIKWVELISYLRFYPDMFYDLIKKDKGGMSLDADQRMLIRSLARFQESMGVFSRGYGKTMVQLMANYHACIFYPDIEIAMTAQTKENAANLIGEKYREIERFFPMLIDELNGAPRISKDKAIINFKSGGMLDTLSNTQSSKGARRKRLTVEESAQVSQALFEDWNKQSLIAVML